LTLSSDEEKQNKTKTQKHKNQPNYSHHLSSNNGVAPICTDAEIKVDLHVLPCLDITCSHDSPVKVDRLNSVSEKEFNIWDGRSLVEETLV
jgi:hypothetical protein